MEREIKFRGYAPSINGGSWVFGFYHEYAGQSYIRTIDGFDFEVVAKSVGQYTGLKDVNGKEIYEGDIVKCIGEGGHEAATTDLIGFKNGCFYLQVRNYNIENWTHYLSRDSEDWNGTFEVVGNKFENPDLLK